MFQRQVGLKSVKSLEKTKVVQPVRGARAAAPRSKVETSRYGKSTPAVSLFVEPPRNKRTFNIGELVEIAFERARLLATEPAKRAQVATALLAEWLSSATLSPAEETSYQAAA